MQVFLRNSAGTITLDVLPNMSVTELISLAERRLAIENQCLRLLFHGRSLDPDAKVEACLSHASTLTFAVTPTGAPVAAVFALPLEIRLGCLTCSVAGQAAEALATRIGISRDCVIIFNEAGTEMGPEEALDCGEENPIVRFGIHPPPRLDE